MCCLVRSTDAIPEPFVTFLVEVNWARGRLMREYTVLLDPPVYTPGENASSSAPVTRTATAATACPSAAVGRRAGSHAVRDLGPRRSKSVAERGRAVLGLERAVRRHRRGRGSQRTRVPGSSAPVRPAGRCRHRRSPRATRSPRSPATCTPRRPAKVDQTMIALYRANPSAFGGNINILRQGAILRVPGADQIAALNQPEAMGEVHRQMDAWRSRRRRRRRPAGICAW